MLTPFQKPPQPQGCKGFLRLRFELSGASNCRLQIMWGHQRQPHTHTRTYRECHKVQLCSTVLSSWQRDESTVVNQNLYQQFLMSEKTGRGRAREKDRERGRKSRKEVERGRKRKKEAERVEHTEKEREGAVKSEKESGTNEYLIHFYHLSSFLYNCPPIFGSVYRLRGFKAKSFWLLLPLLLLLLQLCLPAASFNCQPGSSLTDIKCANIFQMSSEADGQQGLQGGCRGVGAALAGRQSSGQQLKAQSSESVSFSLSLAAHKFVFKELAVFITLCHTVRQPSVPDCVNCKLMWHFY